METPTDGAAGADRAHYHSHALTRGLRVLVHVASAGAPVTLTDLHEATQQPKSTLVRLLAVLEEQDFVLRVDDRPAFVLGHGVLPIVTAYLDSGTPVDLLRPHVRALAHEVGWTAKYAALDGVHAADLCVEFPERPLHFTGKEGGRSPAHASGVGKALLAGLTLEEAREHLPAQPFQQFTERTIVTERALEAELRRIRDRGYAVDDEECARGLRCVAVAVRVDGELLGALGVSGPAAELTPEREPHIVATLRDVAGELVADARVGPVLGMFARGALGRRG
ncbi:IclR family transcriptional regulator [Jiangella sp. DSM 45060]|uniref:IclR family transcriptional regulator n=1 Tax=Jiangella sp. DSM 45060 TaxID=1798224 RepID=UPI00087B2537|nr:IclR family transcriptional regulator [Jiangella sp. DSM 45060]SDT44017.1 transcriptional regulator, IclR family [Jiangella sp. DSM 45060]